MSRKRRKIELNRFYKLYGGRTHPSLVYEKTKLKTYKSIKFGTSKTKHTSEIKPIQKGYEKSFVNNRPTEGTQKDYGNELSGLSIDTSDLAKIEEIKKRPTRKTKRAKKRYEQQKKPPNLLSS